MVNLNSGVTQLNMYLVDGLDHLEELIIRQVLQGELALARVARVGLAEDRVAVARDDALGVEGVPRVLGDSVSVDLGWGW